jgi:aryl-alcohol dehydrogenase-like predicted oxidoreductase
MRRVTLGTTGIETSCLGFGCASLGSRVAAADGLAALAAAHDAGVRWLDLAPLYGGGHAEEIAGRFLKGRPRDAVQICSKVGLLPAGGGGAKARLKAALLPLARRAVQAVPALRAGLRGAGVGGARHLPLTPAALQATIETTLRRLGTDHLDLYALHDASAETVARDEVRRTLEAIVASGKARAVAVAAGLPAAEAALAAGAPYGAVQVGLAPPGAAFDLPARAAAAGMGTIVHSVFGVSGSLAALRARAAADPGLAARLKAEAGEAELDAALGRLLLARALALNPGGVVLVSMFSEQSRRANLALADAAPGDPAALDRLLG